MTTWRWTLCVFLLLMSTPGCSADEEAPADAPKKAGFIGGLSASFKKASGGAGGGMQRGAKEEMDADDEGEGDGDRYAAASPQAAHGANQALSARKVIYSATLSLTTDDAEALGKKLEKMASELKGHISGARLSGSASEGRYGEWTLRIPVARFEEAMGRIAKFGEQQSVERSSKDVTSEYIDVETRLRNSKLEEEHLREYLKKTTKITEILQVEKELTRVRTEIETAQGEFNVLKNEVDLTTITVNAEENRHRSTWAFVRNTFHDVGPESFEILVHSARALIVTIAVLIPWAVPLFFLFRWLYRRWKRKKAARAVNPPTEPVVGVPHA